MLEDVAWQAFHFMRPAWLLVWLPFLLLGYIQWRQQDRLQRWRQLLPEHLLRALTLGDQGWRSHLPLKLMIAVMALASLVAAGPTWQREASPFGEDKAPLLIVLDVSSSMNEQDVAPSRLARAKQKIEDLLALRDGGRNALLVFAGSAHTAMPLTQDRQVFLPLLYAINLKVMPVEGKFAECALPLIERQLRDSATPGSVLLISDGVGDNTVSAFREFFNSSAHQLLVLAVGQQEASSRVPTDWQGLAELAEQSGGDWQALSIDDSDVRWVVRQVNRHMLLNGESAMPWKDMGYVLLFPLALLSLLWFRRGWTIQWALLFVLLLPSEQAKAEWRFADLWLTADQQGQWYFNQGDYLTAAERFRDPLWKGVALYYGGDYATAHSYFLRVDSPQALFNAANALARQREYVAARNLYRLIVKQHPDWHEAKANLALLQALIDEINRMSASQTNDENQSSKELGDNPQTGEGADDVVAQQWLQDEQYTADQLLSDETLNALWMRRVQADPAVFLRNKFAIEAREATP